MQIIARRGIDISRRFALPITNSLISILVPLPFPFSSSFSSSSSSPFFPLFSLFLSPFRFTNGQGRSPPSRAKDKRRKAKEGEEGRKGGPSFITIFRIDANFSMPAEGPKARTRRAFHGRKNPSPLSVLSSSSRRQNETVKRRYPALVCK